MHKCNCVKPHTQSDDHTHLFNISMMIVLIWCRRVREHSTESVCSINKTKHSQLFSTWFAEKHRETTAHFFSIRQIRHSNWNSKMYVASSINKHSHNKMALPSGIIYKLERPVMFVNMMIFWIRSVRCRCRRRRCHRRCRWKRNQYYILRVWLRFDW